MKGPLCFGLVAVFLLEVLGSVRAADTQKHVAVGGTLSLRPPEASTGSINSVLWKHDGNLVAEWVKDKVELEFYSTYRNRSSLDTTNGLLEVQNMIIGDSGIYSVEINNKAQSSGYNVKVISSVPAPRVETQPLICGKSSANCNLLCNGVGSITDAEPVSYSWKRDEQAWQDSTMKLSITNNEETRRVKTFRCRMKNPFSEKESAALDNPFYQEEIVPPSGTSPGLIAFIVLFIIAIGGGLGLAVWKREKIITWINTNIRKQQSDASNKPSTEGEALNPIHPVSAGNSTKDERKEQDPQT